MLTMIQKSRLIQTQILTQETDSEVDTDPDADTGLLPDAEADSMLIRLDVDTDSMLMG